MSPTRTTCPYCGVGCGVLVHPDGRIEGDPEHPANFGRLCSKGAALAETLGLKGRLMAPRIEGREAGWDEALDLVAGRFAEAIARHGPDSVAFYVSGQMLSEDYYVANKLMKGFIGSANIDTNSRLCMASSVAGHRRAFGTDTVPGTYEDLEQADLVVLAGANPAWCHPVLFQRILAAREARPQMRIVVIDPRRTASAEAADLHLAIRPDTDAVLFNVLLARLERAGRIDRAHAQAHLDGLDEALAAARAANPAETGLSPADLALFLDLWTGTEKVVTLWSQGINQSAVGTDKVNAILNCHLATGRIGRPGMGPFSLTGQPNAMGGREVGGLANTLACHLDIENEAHRALVQAHWKAPAICTKPGLKAVELFEACDAGRIKALWIIGTNPAVSMPRADFVSRAIAKVPFTVVSDITETDTTALARVLLPATGWGEKSGTVTNSERRISRQRAFLPAPGQARHDWQIICDVARRMGFEAAFSYDSPAAIFREHAALSALAAARRRDFDIGGLAGLDDAAYESLSPVQWPVPAGGAAGGRFFGKGGFFRPGGKGRLVAVTTPAAGEGIVRRGLRLNTGRVRDQWHTMTRTGRVPRLNRHEPEPFVEIHPDDARALGLGRGDLAGIASEHGRAVLRVRIAPGVRRGTLFAPMHWSGANTEGGRINALVAGERDPLSGQPALKGGRVRLAPFAARWHGFAASESPIDVHRHAHGAVARTDSGWRAELAGLDEPADWQAEARAILGLPEGSASILRDATRGVVRLAIHRGARLRGLFFAAPHPLEVAREHAAGLIGTDTPALEALAGLPVGGRAQAGRTICACFSVGENTLREAIAGGAASLEAIGESTRAGTNCGACRPEISALIAAAATPARAAS